MKKISRFIYYGTICVFLLLLVLQCSSINSKQKELETVNQNCNVLQNALNSANQKCDDLQKELETVNQEKLALQEKLSSESTSPKPVSYNQARLDYAEEVLLACNAIELYRTGEWDGYHMILEEHDINISEDGLIEVDGSHVPEYCNSIDLPDDMEDVQTQCFILDEGTYRLESNRITHYFKGSEIPLYGGTLDWNGMDIENYRPYSTGFYYDEPNDTLFLIATSIPYDLSSSELKKNAGVFLYMVPDRSKSELEFVSEISSFGFDETGFYYSDTSDVIWCFYNKRGVHYFEKAEDSTLWLNGTENINDFRLSLQFAFADGYIHERDAFPEGTFSHPVTTTPYVPLSQYSD